MEPWKTESLSRYPKEFERLNEHQWVQRKNIREVTDPETGDTSYTCECRFITNDEYTNLSMANDISILMDAVADLYIAIASK